MVGLHRMCRNIGLTITSIMWASIPMRNVVQEKNVFTYEHLSLRMAYFLDLFSTNLKELAT